MRKFPSNVFAAEKRRRSQCDPQRPYQAKEREKHHCAFGYSHMYFRKWINISVHSRRTCFCFYMSNLCGTRCHYCHQLQDKDQNADAQRGWSTNSKPLFGCSKYKRAQKIKCTLNPKQAGNTQRLQVLRQGLRGWQDYLYTKRVIRKVDTWG